MSVSNTSYVRQGNGHCAMCILETIASKGSANRQCLGTHSCRFFDFHKDTPPRAPGTHSLTPTPYLSVVPESNTALAHLKHQQWQELQLFFLVNSTSLQQLQKLSLTMYIIQGPTATTSYATRLSMSVTYRPTTATPATTAEVPRTVARYSGTS